MSPRLLEAASESTDGYAAVMLLGGTAFVMMIFYMANAHVKSIHDRTWTMLMTAVSIFVAVMYNTVVNFVITNVFGLDESASVIVLVNSTNTSLSLPSNGAIVCSALHIVICWIFVIALLFVFKSSLLRLKGYGTIGGHIMGFASIGFWSLIIQLEPFRNSAWWIFPVVWAIYMVSMGIFFTSFHFVATVLGKKEGAASGDMDRWQDQSKDTGTDFFCLGQAFLITTWLKYLIGGKLDPAMEDPSSAHEASDMWTLGAVALLFVIFGAVFTVIGHKLEGAAWTDFATTVSCTVGAMCMLDVFSWRILPAFPGTPVIGHMNMAFQLTVLAVGFIFLLAAVHGCVGGISDRALRGVFTALGLAVGSGWEKTFDASVDGLDAFGLNEAKKTLVTILLVVIVFPAWMVYILPKADAELKKEIKSSPPVWAIFCDHNPCDDEDDDFMYEYEDDEA